VPCQFTGEVLLILILLLLLLLLMMMMVMTTKVFLWAVTYFRIADFICFILTFVITDAT
jgi:hypothetical protein